VFCDLDDYAFGLINTWNGTVNRTLLARGENVEHRFTRPEIRGVPTSWIALSGRDRTQVRIFPSAIELKQPELVDFILDTADIIHRIYC
jgi:hypothetical protein